MELNENEQKLFDSLSSGSEVTLDSLSAQFGLSRKAIIVRLKYLAAKIAVHGYIIHRRSSVGRGAKAIYQMEKRF